jgi:hypothetical protein
MEIWKDGDSPREDIMNNSSKSKPVGPMKTIGVWLLLAAISIGSFLITNMLMTGGKPAPAPTQDEPSLSCVAVLILIMSAFCLLVGVIAYFTLLGTNCFTFNFQRPVWHSSLKTRFYVANIFVGTTLLLGLGGIAAAVIGPLLTRFMGISRQLSLMIPILMVLIPGQLLLTWINIWNPVICSLIRKRLLAQGVSEDEIGTGIYAGLSDPEVSSIKKFSHIEDDIGLLWLTPDSIRYRGDSQTFDIKRPELIEVERAVDKGSIAAYAGAVQIILHWKDEGGSSHKRRLHVESHWTLGALGRMFDDLGGKIEAWKSGSSQAPSVAE